MSLPPRGAVFDWDGVIINSAAHHEISWERLAREAGLTLPEDHFVRGFGMKNEFIIPNLLGWTADEREIRRLSLRKEELYREVVAEQGLEALPGVTAWLDRLREAGIPCAVGSSTQRRNLEVALELLGLHDYFSAIVSSEDVSQGKPDPEVFLKAADRIDVPPAGSVVFEDALVGVAAAQAAGMRVAAVTTTNPRGKLAAAKPDWIVDRLDELSVARLWPAAG